MEPEVEMYPERTIQFYFSLFFRIFSFIFTSYIRSLWWHFHQISLLAILVRMPQTHFHYIWLVKQTERMKKICWSRFVALRSVNRRSGKNSPNAEPTTFCGSVSASATMCFALVKIRNQPQTRSERTFWLLFAAFSPLCIRLSRYFVEKLNNIKHQPSAELSSPLPVSMHRTYGGFACVCVCDFVRLFFAPRTVKTCWDAGAFFATISLFVHGHCVSFFEICVYLTVASGVSGTVESVFEVFVVVVHIFRNCLRAF